MKVRKLFESRLATWAATKGIDVAWENAHYTPGDTTYLRAFLLRGATTSRDMAGTNRHRVGVFQVNVVAPLGSGPGAAEAIGEEICTLFPAQLRLTDSAFTVIVTQPMALASGIAGDDRYTVPVSCRYLSDHY